MQSVITQEQAKAVLGGRTPLVPVEYEQAVKALAACITLDEAKYWDNKADALAAWAKIYHSPEVDRKAKQLKLHAYRRMGQLGDEIAKEKWHGRGHPPRLTAMIEAGLTRSQAQNASHVARMPRRKFDAILELPRVPSPGRVRANDFDSSQAWKDMMMAGGGVPVASFRSFCRRRSASELACGLKPDERVKAREIVIEISEWVDEFLQALEGRTP